MATEDVIADMQALIQRSDQAGFQRGVQAGMAENDERQVSVRLLRIGAAAIEAMASHAEIAIAVERLTQCANDLSLAADEIENVSSTPPPAEEPPAETPEEPVP